MISEIVPVAPVMVVAQNAEHVQLVYHFKSPMEQEVCFHLIRKFIVEVKQFSNAFNCFNYRR